MKDFGHVGDGRRVEEEEQQGGCCCGMCDEQGHESGAGETMQNIYLLTLHQPPSIQEQYKFGEQRY